MYKFTFMDLRLLLVILVSAGMMHFLQQIYVYENENYVPIRTIQCQTLFEEEDFYIECEDERFPAPRRKVVEYLKTGRVVGREMEICQVLRGSISGREKTECD